MSDETHLPLLVSAPFIRTERLDLWLPQSTDWRKIHTIVGEQETGRYLGPPQGEDDGFARFLRSSGSWLLYGYGMFILRARGQDQVIGTCGCFHMWRGIGDDMDDVVEAGWIIGADHVSKGYGSEAMRAILAWFDAKFAEPVMCMIDPNNAPSLRLAERLGFIMVRKAEIHGDSVVLLRRPISGRP